MPVVIPIIGAIGAWAFAAPALGTLLEGGLFALNVGEVFALTAAVGATIGAVGAVSRDKDLQTAGLVIGGIGAIGGLASAAGLINGQASVFGNVAVDTAAVPPPNADFINDLNTSVSLPGGSAAYAPALPGAAPATLAGAPLPSPAATNLALVGAKSQALAPVVAATPAGTPLNPYPSETIKNAVALTGEREAGPAASSLKPVLSPAAAAGPAPQTALAKSLAANAPTPAASAGTSSIVTAGTAGAGAAPTAGAEAASKGGLSGVMDFMRKNESATYMLAQVGGALVTGMFNGNLTAAQAANQAAQADLNRQTAAMTQQQLTNMRSPLPIASLKPRAPAPVTGQPAGVTPTYQAQTVGLINSPVTGVPA